jgi:lysophospholipase L1-like esterase
VARRTLSWFTIPLLIGAALLSTSPPARATTATTTPTTRLMVVGDSISQGFGGDWTWRYWLWREVNRQGAAVDFVGPSRTTSGGTRYERPWAWDSDHDAVGGATVNYHQERIAAALTQYTPDVIVVELGVNDLIHGDSAETLVADLQQLLATAWATEPGLKVLLAQVPSIADAAVDARGEQVNSAMASWAVGKAVTIVQNRTAQTLPWDPARFTFDNIHPNATGQTLYAHRFAQALHKAGVLPEFPSGVYHERVWGPDVRPAVTRSGNSLRVDWSQASSEVRFWWVRVVVDGSVASAWSRPSDAGSTLVSVAPGAHRVQLAVKRGRMVASLGIAITA